MSEPREQERVIPDAERARALLEQLKSVHAVDVGRDMVVAAVNFSYPKLGLSDETREVRDLGDVRLSIELIRAILDVLDREHGSAGTSDLHDTLAQMQLAYAHAVQLANAERAAAQEAPAGGPDASAGETAAAAGEPGGEPPAGEPGGEPSGDAAGGDAASGDEAPAAEAAPAADSQPEKKPPAARKKADAPAAPAAKKKPAAKGKPTTKGEPAAKKKPAVKRKPGGDD